MEGLLDVVIGDFADISKLKIINGPALVMITFVLYFILNIHDIYID